MSAENEEIRATGFSLVQYRRRGILVSDGAARVDARTLEAISVACQLLRGLIYLHPKTFCGSTGKQSRRNTPLAGGCQRGHHREQPDT